MHHPQRGAEDSCGGADEEGCSCEGSERRGIRLVVSQVREELVMVCVRSHLCSTDTGADRRRSHRPLFSAPFAEISSPSAHWLPHGRTVARQ